jgi:hypothetical protein
MQGYSASQSFEMTKFVSINYEIDVIALICYVSTHCYLRYEREINLKHWFCFSKAKAYQFVSIHQFESLLERFY